MLVVKDATSGVGGGTRFIKLPGWLLSDCINLGFIANFIFFRKLTQARSFADILSNEYFQIQQTNSLKCFIMVLPQTECCCIAGQILDGFGPKME
jgi:hypothetical protein